ncbi:ABC transporter permease [Lacrimispora sp.]|uniref:ABC transporter permease n=1 Tax=Lacrimispora sp. TaxID=2719234 RepID=UPI00289BB93D|nr:ABC transporter permease subunit [Lacrimispora sp.]
MAKQNSKTAVAPIRPLKPKIDRKLWRKVWAHRYIYLFLLPVVAYYVIFKYVPMYGIVMAFQNYNVFKGVFDSEFVGFAIFQKVFRSPMLWNSIRNTLVLNTLTLLVNFPLTILLSLMLNEIVSDKFKKLCQSVLYLPHFISWVVVAGIATNMFSQRDGTINFLLHTNIPFLSDKAWWIFTYVVCNVWKEIGWGTIIYFAALTGVDESLYEAAYLDGASKLQRLVYITLPSIKPVIVTMLILQISKMMSIGLDAPLLLQNAKVLDVGEVISTYVYRLGILNAKYSESTAIGLFQSVVNIVILLLANKVAERMGEEGVS